MLVARYTSDVERRMLTLYRSLNEKDRRRYAAIEANKLGYGGEIYMIALLGGDYKNLIIRVAHYPPGCSKHNPIEHRLSPHVARKLQWLFLRSIVQFCDLARQATTVMGLRVFARQFHGMYEIGRRASVKSVQQLRVLFDPVLPHWNYFVLPTDVCEVI